MVNGTVRFLCSVCLSIPRICDSTSSSRACPSALHYFVLTRLVGHHVSGLRRNRSPPSFGRLVMQPPDSVAGSLGTIRRPTVVDTAASATDLPELRQSDQHGPEKVIYVCGCSLEESSPILVLCTGRLSLFSG